jgi:solute carrier family 25 carnitine/acylcarnitine transporter 20/29
MDYLIGGLAGMYGVLISHPFDTIKTFKQTGKVLPKPITISFLYRGIYAPLIGTSIEKSIVFGSYSWLSNNTNLNIGIKGLITGFIASTIITPYERIKILQQQKIKVNIRSIYTGFISCALRDSIGFSIYFSTYEYLKNKYIINNNMNTGWSFLFGGMSGAISWVFIYPFDKIKTIVQSSTSKVDINTINLIIRTNNLYSGFRYALYRAIPLHAGTFYMFEILKQIK